MTAKASVLFSICWLTFIFIVFSDAVANIFITVCVCLFLLIWGVSLFVRAVLALLHHWRHESRDLTESNWWRWTIELSILLLSIILIRCQIPFTFRLKLSETALIEYIQAVKKGIRPQRSTTYPARWVGLFRVEETGVLDDGTVRMITTDVFLHAHAGFVYSPNRQPPIIGKDSYRHLYGAWWYWLRN